MLAISGASQLTGPTGVRAPVAPALDWLRSRRFDLTLVMATLALALAAGLAVALDGRLLAPVLLADLWLLGFHHVVATYTRLSPRQHRFLVVHLPLLVIAGVLALVLGLGAWAVISLYFYWQWFHYARQSWGISELYRRKAAHCTALEPRWLMQLSFYALPVYGIAHRSAKAGSSFLGVPLKLVPVSAPIESALAALALAGVGWFLVTRFLLWRRGVLPRAQTLYILSHHAIFYVGYVASENVDAGWVTTNIWHNAQYILIVWLFNTRRFQSGVDTKAPWLSYLSQRRNLALYLVACLCTSTLLYGSLAMCLATTPIMALAYPTLNFHHYIADSRIWKSRRTVSIAT